ncbi:uncharacterized protein PG986_006904 [Apiospora aurea]|uniref:Uncharacterized protein n=1 Tax=Apiospora aurea TaxID=335848 RepID=A0ABR1QB14_9PEZI
MDIQGRTCALFFSPLEPSPPPPLPFPSSAQPNATEIGRTGRSIGWSPADASLSSASATYMGADLCAEEDPFIYVAGRLCNIDLTTRLPSHYATCYLLRVGLPLLVPRAAVSGRLVSSRSIESSA